jgi:hypothetical protein
MSRCTVSHRWLLYLVGLSLTACAPAMPAPVRLEGRPALVRLGEHYASLYAGAEAILAATDTIGRNGTEPIQVLAGQLAGELAALQRDFESTTASLRTDQLDVILPLWERMAVAQAGLSMLRDEAAHLREDPAAEAYELQAVAEQLEAVLQLALYGQQGALEALEPPERLVYSGT